MAYGDELGYGEAIANEMLKGTGFGRNPDGSWDWSLERIGENFRDDPLSSTLNWLTLAVPVAKWGTALKAATSGVGAVGKAYQAGEFAGRTAKASGLVQRAYKAFAGEERFAAAKAYAEGPRRGLALAGGRFQPLGRFTNPIAQELSPEYMGFVERYGAEWWESRAISRSTDRERVVAENLVKRRAEDVTRALTRSGLTKPQMAQAQRFLEEGVDPSADVVRAAFGGNEAGVRAYKDTWGFRNAIHEQAFESGLISEETYRKNLGKYAPRIYTEWEKIRGAQAKLGEAAGVTGGIGGGAARFQNRAEEALFEQVLDPRASVRELAKAGQVIARQRYAQGLASSAVAQDAETIRDLAVRALEPGAERFAQLHGIDGKRREAVQQLIVSARKVGRPVDAEAAAQALGWQRIDDLYEGGKLPGYVARLPQELRGKWLDPAAADDIVGGLKQMAEPEWYAKIYQSVLSTFRASKTAYNPATHVRNLIGGAVFHHLTTGGVPKLFPKAGRAEWLAQGEAYQAAREAGIIGSSFDAELRTGLREAFGGTNADEKFLGQASSLDWMGDSKLAQLVQKGASSAERAYRATDEWWKLDAWMGQAAKYEKRGMSRDLARQAATLDVNKFSPNFAMHSDVANVLRKAVPFSSFTTETLRVWKNVFAEKPHLGYFWAHNMEALSQTFGAAAGFSAEQLEEAKKALPEYQQGKKMVILPVNVDGEPRFLDMSYMIPLGNIGGHDTSEKLFFGALFDVTNNPLLNAAAAVTTGKDPFSGREIAPNFTERQLGQAVSNPTARKIVGLVEHMAATMLPPLAPPGYAGTNLLEAARGQMNPATGEPLEDGVLRTILQNVAGLRTYSADVNSQILNVRREQGRTNESMGQAWQRWEFAKANGDMDAMAAEQERIIGLRLAAGYEEREAASYFRESAEKRGPLSNLSKRQMREVAGRARRLGGLSPRDEKLRQELERKAR